MANDDFCHCTKGREASKVITLGQGEGISSRGQHVIDQRDISKASDRMDESSMPHRPGGS